jgi:hypothetical protein
MGTNPCPSPPPNANVIDLHAPCFFFQPSPFIATQKNIKFNLPFYSLDVRMVAL